MRDNQKTKQQLIAELAEARKKLTVLESELMSRQTVEAPSLKMEEMDNFFRLTLDLLCIADTDGNFLRLSTAWEKTLGYTHEELMAGKFFDFIHPEDIQGTLDAVSRLISQHEVHNFVNRYRCRDGSYRWLEWRSVPAGKLIYAAARDITERKQAEADLQRSQGMLERAQEIARLGYWEFDLNRGTVWASSGARRIYGLGERELTIEAVQKIPLPEYRQALDNEMKGLIKHGEKYDIEFRIRRPRDNQVIDIHSIAEYDPKERKIFGIIQDISERTHTEKALRESEALHRFLTENANDMLTRHRPDSTILYVTPSCEVMLGYRPEEMTGRPASDFVAPGDMKDIWKAFRTAEDSGEDVYRVEFRMIRRDGSPMWAETVTRLIRDGQGNVVEAHSSVRDISRRKKAEEERRKSEEKFSKVFRSSPAAITITRLSDGLLIDANEALLKLLKYRREEIIGHTAAELHIWADYEDRMRLTKRLAEERSVKDQETRFRASDGEIKIARYSAEVAEIGGEPCILSLLVDIGERKRMEDALIESEERYRALFENAIEGIFQSTLEGRGIMANSALARILGYDTPQEAVENLTDIGSQVYADPEERRNLIDQLIREGTVTGKEVLFKRRDGTKIKVMLNFRLVRDKDGNPTSIEGSCIDITGRWLAEEALKASEEKYRSIFENATEAIFQTTLEGRYLSMNPALARMFGYSSPGEMMESVRDIGHDLYVNPKDREEMVRIIREEGKVEGYDVELYRKDGARFWISLNIHAVKDAEGNIMYLEGTHADITERKHMEQEIKESEEKFRLLFEKSADGSLIIDGGRYIDCNEAALRIAGCTSKDQLLGLKPTDISPEFQPDGLPSSEKAARMIELALEKGSHQFEWVRKRFDGTERYLDVMLTAIPMKGKQLLYTTWRDITERKQMEESLQESEARIREIIENAPFGAHSYRLMDDGKLIFRGANPAADRILNIDHSSLMGMEIEAAFPMLKGTGVAENYRDVARTGRRWVQDVVQYEAKSITGAFEVYAFQTGPNRMTVFFQDITERKKAEVKLREQEELLRTTINATADGILVVDRDLKISHMNRQFAEMWHIPQELRDIQDERKLLDFVLDQLEDQEGFRSRVMSLYQSSAEDLDEIRFRDGRVFERYSCPLILEGKEAGRIWDFRDITERKHAEEALRASEARYRKLYDSMMDAFVSVSLDGTIWECNEALLAMLGYERDEIRRLTYRDITPEKWHDFEAKVIEKEVMARGYSDSYEKEYRRKDGTVIQVELRTYLIRDEEGDPAGMWAITRDITGRKQAEDQLKAANRQLESIIEFLPDATIITDSEGRIIAWNRAIEEMTGVPKARILGRDHHESAVPFYGKPGPSLIDFLGRDDREILSWYKNISRKGDTLYAEVFTPALYQGKGAHIWAIASPLYDRDGNTVGAIESIRDITARKRAEEALNIWMRRYDLIVEASGQVAYEYIVPTGEIVWGRSIEKVLGYTMEEISGGFDQWKDLLHPDDREFAMNLLEEAERSCTYWDAQYRMRNRDGHYVWVRDRGFFLPDANGKAYNQLGMLEDITEHRQAEEELKRSEQKYRDIFEDAVIGIYQSTPDGRYLTVNPSFARIFGYESPEEMIASVTDIGNQFYVNPDDRLRLMNRLKERGRIEGFDVQVLRRDGSRLWINMNAHTVRDKDGNVQYYEGTCVDITARKKAEEALRESEQYLADIIDFLPDATLVIDREGTVIAWNRAMEDMTGVKAGDMMGRGNYEYAIPFYGERRPILIDIALLPHEEIAKNYSYLRREGSLIIGETDVPKVKGQKRFLSGWAQPIYDSSGEVIGAIECIRDNTEKHRAEEALSENEARYRLLADNASDIIFTMDRDLRFTYVSPSVERIRGYTTEEVMNQSIDEVLTPGSFQTATEVFSEEMEKEAQRPRELWRKRTLELEEYCRGGSTIWTETTFTPLRDKDQELTGFLGITRDITERRQVTEEKKRLETQLLQAQKMESIGTLAGGIAHDFNNILSAIIGYTELAISDIDQPQKSCSELKEVLKAGDRAKDLVKQILTFSRRTEITYAPLSLQSTLKETVKMLRSIIPSTIEIRLDIADSGIILSDPTQVNQIIMNLCANAAHAMDAHGGVIGITLKRVILDKTAALGLNVAPGSYMNISISDTGHGMSPEIIDRIFEPYFTTKEMGRGTGLGLSVVHGIVLGHRGAITCRSVPGQGTTFDVYLPEIKSASADNRTEERLPYPTGRESILVVDDEPALTDLAKKLLSKLGYTVISRNSSMEALELFRKRPDQFDLVITDMTMPFMTGDKLAQQILAIRKNIPIILCTGYSEFITEEKARQMGIRQLLMKPLESEKLALTVRRVLDGEPDSA